MKEDSEGKSLMVKLQQATIAKKTKNAMGRYNYRSLEDINQAIKPILQELNIDITFREQITEVAGIPFLKATAYATNGSELIGEGEGWAGIDIHSKNMSIGQQTGASSSYARKYALGALLLIDDNDDLDDNGVQLSRILSDINRCNSLDELTKCYNEYSKYYDIPEITKQFITKKGELVNVRH